MAGERGVCRNSLDWALDTVFLANFDLVLDISPDLGHAPRPWPLPQTLATQAMVFRP